MEEVKRNSLRAWILAARPKTLTGAITPVMIGSALAYMMDIFNGCRPLSAACSPV